MLDRLQRDIQLLLHYFTPVNIFTMHNVKEMTLQNINIDTIFKYRYFIVDLHQRLVELHQKQYSTESSLKSPVFRGQLISTEELTKLKANIGGVFSVNTFFSTTTLSNVALNFFTDTFERPFVEKVLYEINVSDHSQWKWPFADVHDVSCNDHEGEILFGIGSTFRIDDVYEYTDNLWYVSLTLLDINDPSAGIDTQLYDYLVENSLGKDEPTLLILCNFLEQMGKFERSRQFCQLMMRDTPEGQQLIDIHAHLILIEYDLGNFQTAKTMCEQTLAMHMDLDQRNNGVTASSALNHLHTYLGLIHSELGDYKSAVYHYRQVVLIDEVLLDEDDVNRAVDYNNLGMAYQDLGNFKEALYWLEERALKLQLLKLPHNHPDLAVTYCNNGETYSENGNSNRL